MFNIFQHLIFGSNPYLLCFMYYLLYTIAVFDDWHNSIPMVNFIISNSYKDELRLALQALKNKTQDIKSN